MKPEDRITAYLFANKSKVEFSTLDLVVKDVKFNVFYGMSPLSDEAIRKVVVGWATVHAVGLLITPPAGGPAPAGESKSPPRSDSEFIESVKKAVSTVADGVTIGRKGANVNIGVTGLTANLKKSGKSTSLGVSWGGTLKLEAASGPIHFVATLNKESWEMVLSFPQDSYIPDLSMLGKVVTEGENALGKMVDATSGFKSIGDARKIGSLIKPHADAVEKAVDAVGGIAKANKKGGASFGFKFGSPEPAPGEQGIPKGVQGSIVFTYVF